MPVPCRARTAALAAAASAILAVGMAAAAAMADAPGCAAPALQDAGPAPDRDDAPAARLAVSLLSAVPVTTPPPTPVRARPTAPAHCAGDPARAEARVAATG